MTALRMRARDVLSEDELVAVRERFTWKGVAMIVHAWVLILARSRWWRGARIHCSSSWPIRLRSASSARASSDLRS